MRSTWCVRFGPAEGGRTFSGGAISGVVFGTGRSKSAGAAIAGRGAATSNTFDAGLALTGTISTGSNGRGIAKTAGTFWRAEPLGFTPTAPTTALQSEAQSSTV